MNILVLCTRGIDHSSLLQIFRGTTTAHKVQSTILFVEKSTFYKDCFFVQRNFA